MDKNSFESESFNTTTSSSITGGCFVLNIPPLLFVFVTAAFILFFGKTDNINPEIETQKISPIVDFYPGLSPIFTPEIQHWSGQIIVWSEEWDLDPNLIATVMQIESCGNPDVVSPAGAIGLFQVMPYHFSDDENPIHPSNNAKRGLGYFSKSLETHKTIRLALAGYNGGIAGAGNPESQWPAETVRYVYWGENIYQEALSGLDRSPTLEEWLNAGGASLCALANDVLEIN